MGGFGSGGSAATRSGSATASDVTPTGETGITGTTGLGPSATAYTGAASGIFSAGRGVWGVLVGVLGWWFV